MTKTEANAAFKEWCQSDIGDAAVDDTYDVDYVLTTMKRLPRILKDAKYIGSGDDPTSCVINEPIAFDYYCQRISDADANDDEFAVDYRVYRNIANSRVLVAIDRHITLTDPDV